MRPFCTQSIAFAIITIQGMDVKKRPSIKEEPLIVYVLDMLHAALGWRKVSPIEGS